MTVYTVDADSRTFEDDLGYVFRQHVRKVRRPSNQSIGSAKRVAAKR
jgi:hypothetical protein